MDVYYIHDIEIFCTNSVTSKWAQMYSFGELSNLTWPLFLRVKEVLFTVILPESIPSLVILIACLKVACQRGCEYCLDGLDLFHWSSILNWHLTETDSVNINLEAQSEPYLPRSIMYAYLRVQWHGPVLQAWIILDHVIQGRFEVWNAIWDNLCIHMQRTITPQATLLSTI